MSPLLALLPLRNGQRFGNKKMILLCPKKKEDGENYHHPSSPSSSSIEIGRLDFIPCLHECCGCDPNKRFGSTRNKCSSCQMVNSWAMSLSRKMIRFSGNSSLQCKSTTSASVSIRGVDSEKANIILPNDEWSDKIEIKKGTIISLDPKLSCDNGMESLDFEVVTVDSITMKILDTYEEEDRQEQASTVIDSQDSYIASPLYLTQQMSPRNYLVETKEQTNYCPHVKSNKESTVTSNSEPTPPPTLARSNESQTKVTSNSEPATPTLANSTVSSNSEPAHNLSPTVTKTEDNKSCNFPAIEAPVQKRKVVTSQIPTLVKSLQNEIHDKAAATSCPDDSSKKSQYILYFCALGQDLSKVRIKILSKMATDFGAEVVQDFRSATHIILADNSIQLVDFAKILGINEDELRTHISKNEVVLVLPQWLTNSKISRKPLLREKHHESWNISSPGKKRKLQKGPTPEEIKKRRVAVNSEFAEVFKRLAVLHQACPLEDLDMWKAYTFRIVAGRIQNLDFEIKNDEATLKRLGGIKGIGSRCIVHLKQYLNNNGEVERIVAFESDPKRVAMKKMMDIWGVGRKKALYLVLERKFSTIEDVRNALVKKELELERNQLVGVDCYEDILEEMTRDEVERIGEIISNRVQDLYPGAEVRIMGSYRRGKPTCGDVDVHITHKSFECEIPKDALGRVVDSLWKTGDIAFHLTFLPGMETGMQLSDFEEHSKSITSETWKSQCIQSSIIPKREKSEKTSSTYMGVFNSPIKVGRRRRVDLKFYPFRERIFAALYFTGNGFFNRSMRLWARNFGYQLNDHGLFHRESKKRIMEATQEQEVFEKLELVYKEPHERDCFDALEPRQKGRPIDLEMSSHAFQEDNHHAWVN